MMDTSTGQIFVFGSNKAGRHGKGAAATALRVFGAKYGQGEGLQGRSYAIPTKDEDLKVLSLDDIADNVGRFLLFASQHLELKFLVTKIGCGLAGYEEWEIGPMFRSASKNCELPEGWRIPVEEVDNG